METLINTFILPIVLSLISVWICLPVFIRYSHKKALIDIPNNRASHSIPTPTSGGITFILPVLITFIFSNELPVLLPWLFLLIIALGFADDRLNLSPLIKLFVQALITLGLYFSGIHAQSLEVILGVGQLPFFLSVLLTFFLVAGQINAFNLIDGIDGLAGGIGLINTLVFGILFYFSENYGFALLNLTVAAGLFAFLRFNFHPAKLFMGDAGSLLIGLLSATSFLQILNFGNPLFSTLAFACVLFPCMDMLRLFITRILNKRSPFSADKNHYHHLLLRLGDNHRRASLICYAIQLLLLVSGGLLLELFSFRQTNFILLTSGVIIYTIIELRYLFIRWHNRRNYQLSIRNKVKENQLLKRII